MRKVFVFQNAKDAQGIGKKITLISLDRDPLQRAIHAQAPRGDFEDVSSDTISSGFEYWLFFDLAVFAEPKCLRIVAALEWWLLLFVSITCLSGCLQSR